MATKPFLLVMNKFEYDPIAPVNTPKVLTPGATTDPTIPKLQPAMAAQYSKAIPAATKEMDPAVIAAIVGGAVTIGTSIANYVQQRKLQKRQEEYQKEYFDYTFNKQTQEKWNEINYNDPFQQMQRLKNAGLNENLMYGTLGNVAGASGTAPANAPSGLSGSAPSVAPYFDSGSVIQALLSPLQSLSQISLNKSQAFKNYKSAGLDQQNANRLATLTPLEAEKYQYEMDNLQDQNTLLKSYIQQSLYDEEQKRTYLYFIDKMYDAQVREVNARAFSYSASAQLSLQQVDKIEQEILTIFPELARMYRASADEKFQIANSIAKKLPDELRQIAAYADVSEKDVENYFWVRLMPSYFAPVVNAGGNVGSAAVRGMKK